jgi:hypothetical protein
VADALYSTAIHHGGLSTRKQKDPRCQSIQSQETTQLSSTNFEKEHTTTLLYEDDQAKIPTFILCFNKKKI